MIRAMIFDLDGTLVKTERLKALSYARAAIELCPHAMEESEVVEAFKEVVGRSRQEVAVALVDRFDLNDSAQRYMDRFGVSTPWQAFVQVRLQYYEKMLEDPRVLLANQWPHNMSLLQQARETGCKLALATMSYCVQVQRVLKILELSDVFDFVASRDDVEYGKPNPEIYELVARELHITPEDCLVIEDSPSGVKAAIAAGMWCIAVTTPFTRDSIHKAGILDEKWIVDEADGLPGVVSRMLKDRGYT